MSDLAGNPYASIVELSKAYRNKSVSPSEVTKAQLARIDASIQNWVAIKQSIVTKQSQLLKWPIKLLQTARV